MLQQIEIQLTEVEKLALEFQNFQYNCLQINFNQFMTSNYHYNEEHYTRLIDTLIEKYTLLQKSIFEILNNHGYASIPVQDFYSFVNSNILIINPSRR